MSTTMTKGGKTKTHTNGSTAGQMRSPVIAEVGLPLDPDNLYTQTVDVMLTAADASDGMRNTAAKTDRAISATVQNPSRLAVRLLFMVTFLRCPLARALSGGRAQRTHDPHFASPVQRARDWIGYGRDDANRYCRAYGADLRVDARRGFAAVLSG